MLASLLFPAILAFGDQVTLNNGDRLTGTISKADGKTLVIKTEFAGEVTVQWPAISAIDSAQPLHVALKGGQTVVGALKTTDGSLEVTPTNAAPVPVTKDAVVSLRSQDEEAAYEKTLHPGLNAGLGRRRQCRLRADRRQ